MISFSSLRPAPRSVRVLASAIALLGALVLAGCESMSSAGDSVKQVLADRDPSRTRVFPKAEPREVYAAALKASERMGFRYLRGGPAQGRLEAASGLVAGKSLATTQQLTLKARFEIASPAGTEVFLNLYEVIEGDASRAAGQGVSAPLRDTPLYESFFREIQAVLDARP